MQWIKLKGNNPTKGTYLCYWEQTDSESRVFNKGIEIFYYSEGNWSYPDPCSHAGTYHVKYYMELPEEPYDMDSYKDGGVHG